MLITPISAPRCLGSRATFNNVCALGGKQQVVKYARVVQRQHIEFVRHGEHDVEVDGGEKLALASCEPVFARLRLALRAMPIAAGVIRDGPVTALGTSINMAAQRSRAAALNGAKGLELLKVEAPSIPIQEAVALRAEDVGHLHGGPAHFCRGRW